MDKADETLSKRNNLKETKKCPVKDCLVKDCRDQKEQKYLVHMDFLLISPLSLLTCVVSKMVRI